MSGIPAFPLQWPAGWPRTAPWKRSRSNYDVLGDRAQRELLRSLRLLGAKDVVVSSNVRLRLDGMPYAGETGKRYEESGVAVYFKRGDRNVVLACDKWLAPDENIRAIGLAVEGMRAIARSGAAELLDRAFTGFLALPEPEPPWWEILGVDRLKATRESIEEARRARAKVVHPDVGGSDAAFRQLERAVTAALREVPA